jgi:hypothetical protein
LAACDGRWQLTDGALGFVMVWRADERHAKRSEMLIVGVAVLYVFIQANITGCTPVPPLLPPGFRHQQRAVAELRRAAERATRACA